jgi:hypothetical protein
VESPKDCHTRQNTLETRQGPPTNLNDPNILIVSTFHSLAKEKTKSRHHTTKDERPYLLPFLHPRPKMSSIGYCLTPKQGIIGIDNIQPCPPPPQAFIQEVIEELLVPTLELCDAPLGFFFAAPCNSSNANHRRVQFKNKHVKLMPRKSRNDQIKLQPKKKSIDWAVGATTITRSNRFEVH